MCNQIEFQNIHEKCKNFVCALKECALRSAVYTRIKEWSLYFVAERIKEWGLYLVAERIMEWGLYFIAKLIKGVKSILR